MLGTMQSSRETTSPRGAQAARTSRHRVPSRRGLLLVLTALLTTACVTAPVYQPTSTVPTAAARPDLRAAILAGLATKGWRVAREGPGVIEATVRAGGHTATVAIRYGGNQYSIQYVSSSEGLKYDGETIHRRYNHWVRLLDDAIYKAATSGGPPRPPQ
jgi:hypothetical protein